MRRCATSAWRSRPATRRSEYEITFLEIGADRDHVHFLVQSVPTYSPTQIVRTVKMRSRASRPARSSAASPRSSVCSKVLLGWGGAFWSSGFYIDTVGRHGSEETIRRYVQEQGTEQEYKRLHSQQMELF